tara:strand:+ start:524 stop:787 length:264 start_codon:yes stop_codon:yes gene_type:complete
MIKELKYLFFVVTIFVFIFLTLKYYFSDVNKKNSYRSLNQNPKKIIDYSKKVILLKDNTDNIVEYVEKAINKNKKDYNFWKLIYNDE